MKQKTIYVVAFMMVTLLCSCGMVDSYADKVTSQLSSDMSLSNSNPNMESEQNNPTGGEDSVLNVSSSIDEKDEGNNSINGNDSFSSEEASNAESSVENKKASKVSKMVVIDEPLREYVDDRSETQKAIDETNREVDESAYALGYPDATDLIDTVTVDERFANEEVIIYISYSEALAIPREASLTTPSGEKYPPCWNNDGAIYGMVYWRIQNPDPGDYTIQLSANIQYGTYMTDVMDSHLFSEMYIERTGITYAPPSD